MMVILTHRDKREWEPLLGRMVGPGERIMATNRRTAERFLHAGDPNYRWSTDFPPKSKPPEPEPAPVTKAPRKRKRSKK